MLNQKLADVIIDTLGCGKDMHCSELSSAKLEELICRLCEYEFPVTKYRDYEFAQVCTGGISPDELDWSTLESKLVPNVYFAGEIIDVDALTGGYNLQIAYSTGYTSGL